MLSIHSPMHLPDSLLSVSRAAHFLHISPVTLKRLKRLGLISTLQLHEGQIVYHVSDLTNLRKKLEHPLLKILITLI